MSLPPLNPQQDEAVQYDGHALCILAGAGSGKTRVITHRIVDLVQRRSAQASSVLAVTFTNKAAREMRERVERLLPGRGRALTVATFHSACARILREHGESVGLSPHFTIYDDEESARLVQQLLDGRSTSRQDARLVAREIERARNAGQDARSMEVSDFDVPGRRARELIDAYQAALRQADATDFAGLLLDVVRLLEADGPEARALQARYRHLLVDEYQDTNAVQARLVYALGRPAQSVTVVGDDDQSIYAWRGASADNLLDFLHGFPGAHTVRLEQNYRSTATILEAANAVIAHNPGRLEKKLFTAGPGGSPLRILGCDDDRNEAHRIVDCVAQHLRGGLRADQVAVLYRTNAQSRVIEDVMRRRRVPYRVVGGVHFYDRREVKDLVAYLRLAVNPRSDVDLLRVLNVPARGLGDTTRQRLVQAGARQGKPLHEVMGDTEALAALQVKSAAASRLRALAELIASLGHQVVDLGAEQAVRVVAMQCGLVEAFQQEAAQGGARGMEAAERLDNIGALVSAAHDFSLEAMAQGQAANLVAFLEEAALATDVESSQVQADGEAVTLMTLHAAKGLEFDAVILCGLEEGLFPQGRDGGLDDPDRLGEERRLCYVGITRARQHLTLTWARRRQTFGETRPGKRSRFLDDIPAQLVVRGESGYRDAPPRRPSSPRGQRPTGPPATRRDVDIDMDFGAEFIDDEIVRDLVVEGPRVGSRVHHATFGEGVVQALEGQGPQGRLVIQFGASIKRVVARYVTLAKEFGS
ncbi:MAG: UvrD-helicase domain-containing protein [Pseudomonadota bacterium]